MQVYCTFVLFVNQRFPGLPASGTHYTCVLVYCTTPVQIPNLNLDSKGTIHTMGQNFTLLTKIKCSKKSNSIIKNNNNTNVNGEHEVCIFFLPSR
jgi:hypothetical protein